MDLMTGPTSAITPAVTVIGHPRDTNLRSPFGVLLWGTGTLLLLLLAEPLAALPERPLYALATGISAAAMIAVRPRRSSGAWSSAWVYLVVFSIFHFGLLLVIALGLPLPTEVANAIQWYWPRAEAVRHAAVSSVIGVAACVTGVLVVRLGSPAQPRSHPLDTVEERAVARVGLALVALSVATWLYGVLAAGGPTLLVASYGVFLERTRASNLSALYFTMGLGVVFTSAVTSGSLRWVTWGLFGAFGLVALPLGLRGEVLFPAATAVAVGGTRFRMSLARASVLALVLLGVIAGIRGIRQYGVSDLQQSAIEASPHAALAELGGTIRPVAVVISWADAGEKPLYGATYWAPLDRALYHVIPGWTRVEADDDERLLNVVIARRVSTIGLSPIAEAYRNFGDPGVLGFMLLLGVLLGRMDATVDSTRQRLKNGIVLFPLLIFVRNAFTPVPAQIIGGFALYALALLLAGRRILRFR
jgi:hypothetical protein